MFPTTRGAPQDGGSVSHQFAKRVMRANELAKQLGQPELPHITIHGLRHSAATMLLAQGLTLGEVQKVLGHCQIALSADLYTQFALEIAGRAAGAMDTIFGAS